MSQKQFLTAPVKTDKMPPGIPYIVGNEAAERFTYYGLRTILVVYMTQYLVNANGQHMSDDEATKVYHLFQSSAYFFPILGAILSDAFLGKYHTILSLSVVYSLGAGILAFVPGTLGLYLGMFLIALGTGGIKPCVSAHLGDQFGETNKGLLTKAFGWFYFSINFGSLFSTFLTPILLKKYNPQVAFGIPAALMISATVIFWMGRYKFIHIPPVGSQFVKETFSYSSLKTIGKVLTIFAFLPVFWALYDQTASRWVLQAEKMNRHVFSTEILPAQMQVLNPLFVLIFIPLFTLGLYPAMAKIWPMTPLRRIGTGLFITAISFLPPAYIEHQIGAGHAPHIAWQALAYFILTGAEVMVSITALEFAYTQAPTKLKSLVMSIFLLTVSMGNFLTAAINWIKDSPVLRGRLEGANYYLFFTFLMFVTAILFVFVARAYKEQTFLHKEEDSAAA